MPTGSCEEEPVHIIINTLPFNASVDWDFILDKYANSNTIVYDINYVSRKKDGNCLT